MREKSFSTCTISELKEKEVINVYDGARLGNLSDIIFDPETGKIISVILPGNYRLMGFLGKDDDVVIKWEDIKKIGDDVIIINSQ